MTDFETALAALLGEIDLLKADNAYLRRENASLWESVHERDAMLVELQQMAFRAVECP